MEYRLFTIVRYNYGYYNTIAQLPIKRDGTSFGPRGPQALFPLPFHTHNLNHVSVFLYSCVSCFGLACLTLVTPSPYSVC